MDKCSNCYIIDRAKLAYCPDCKKVKKTSQDASMVDVLNKIREEIDEIPLSEPMVSMDGLYCYGTKSITVEHFREKVFEVIDKYRTESEDKK